jgi:hypothetical protein
VTVSYGPLTCGTVGPSGPLSDCTIYDSGQLGAPISAFAGTWNASSTLTGAAWHGSVDWFDYADALISVDDSGTLYFGTTNTVTLTPTPPSGATRAVIRFGAALTGILTASCTGTGTITTGVYCAYGTTTQGGASQAVLIGLELVTAIAGLLAAPWLLVFLIPAVGLQIDVALLCASPMPAAPQLQDLSRWTPNDAKNFVQAAIWNTWCMCRPATGGGPAPLSPPPPVPVPPNSTATPPTYTPVGCDTLDICAMLNTLSLQVGSLQQQVAILNPLLTFVQRQGVPAAYVPGTLHSGLSGSGTIAIASVLGLSVQVSTIPSYLSSDMAPVQSWFKFGELSWGTAEGWQARRVVTHNPHLFLELDADLTTVAYLFLPGVVANILELVREP